VDHRMLGRFLRYSKQKGEHIIRLSMANHAAAKVIGWQSALLDECEVNLPAKDEEVPQSQSDLNGSTQFAG
jgi:hypothetical protein